MPMIKVSNLIANPSLLLSLSLTQREALRQAAEGKWLERNPNHFEPLGGIEGPRNKRGEKREAVGGEEQATAKAVESEVAEQRYDNEQRSSKLSAARKRALAETGGLVVPVRSPIRSHRMTSTEVYLPSI